MQHINTIAGFDALWELDIFGKYRREFQAARADTSAARAARYDVLTMVVADVVRATTVTRRPIRTRADADTSARWPGRRLACLDVGGGIPYRLELTASPSYGSTNLTDLGDLRLLEGDELVMHLGVSQHIDREFAPWRVFGVSALRVGPWMSRLNEIAGRLGIRRGSAPRPHNKTLSQSQEPELD